MGSIPITTTNYTSLVLAATRRSPKSKSAVRIRDDVPLVQEIKINYATTDRPVERR